MSLVSNVIENLELAKNKLDDLKLEAEEKNNFSLAESLDDYMSSIQLVIDTLSDDSEFMTRAELIAKAEEEDDTL